MTQKTRTNCCLAVELVKYLTSLCAESKLAARAIFSSTG